MYMLYKHNTHECSWSSVVISVMRMAVNNPRSPFRVFSWREQFSLHYLDNSRLYFNFVSDNVLGNQPTFPRAIDFKYIFYQA